MAGIGVKGYRGQLWAEVIYGGKVINLGSYKNSTLEAYFAHDYAARLLGKGESELNFPSMEDYPKSVKEIVEDKLRQHNLLP